LKERAKATCGSLCAGKGCSVRCASRGCGRSFAQWSDTGHALSARMYPWTAIVANGEPKVKATCCGRHTLRRVTLTLTLGSPCNGRRLHQGHIRAWLSQRTSTCSNLGDTRQFTTRCKTAIVIASTAVAISPRTAQPGAPCVRSSVPTATIAFRSNGPGRRGLRPSATSRAMRLRALRCLPIIAFAVSYARLPEPTRFA
jgi:hypothetical protein